MLLMVEKSIRWGICSSIYQYGITNNIYMKDFDKNQELLDLRYWDVNNLYGCHKSFEKTNLSKSKILLNLMKIS